MFCSCSDRGEDISGRRYPILFGSTDTRAVADITDLQNNGFKVYAHFEGSLSSASFNDEVEYNSTYSVWGFKTAQYWIPSTKYWFTAFYPTTSSAGKVEVTEQESNYHSYTITNFDITKQEDIMVAQAYREVGANADAPTEGSVVNLNFQHLLACVVVKVQSQISGVKVTNVELGIVKSDGEYNSTSETWTCSGTATIKRENLAVDIPITEFADITDEGILVLPQTVADQGVKLTVMATGAPRESYEVYIPAIEWVKGNKYTYTMIIKQGYIVFNEPTVEQWDEENATGSVIIK